MFWIVRQHIRQWGHLAESVSCLWSFQYRLGATLLGGAEDRHPLVANVDDGSMFLSIYVNQMFLYVALRRVAVGSSQVHHRCSEPPATVSCLVFDSPTFDNIVLNVFFYLTNEAKMKKA